MAFKPMSIGEFKRNTGIADALVPRKATVISLRELAQVGRVEQVRIMPKEDYLDKMLRRVRLANGGFQLYAQSEFSLERVSPFSFKVIQTFVHGRKIMEFLQEFNSVFDGSCASNGFAKKTPMIILGRHNKTGQVLLANYLPPIIELCSSGEAYLPDGMHRCFLANRVGTTVEAIVIKNVLAPPRADLIDWNEVCLVDEKPPIDQRVRNNNPDLYRGWELVGIDG
ncbi:MAG: hypothetical protein WCW56_01705 [Candidatus Paceibacterota bacterium]|jgi:hypothetical protein